jgi:spermidine synthase
LVFIIFFLLEKKTYHSIYLPFAIFSTGIIAMIFSLVISLGFQIRYGYLYYKISILLTTFIAGTTLGGYLGNTYLPNKRKYFLLIESAIIILLLILTLSLHNQTYPSIFGSQIDFFIFLIISGMLVGLEFPLANKLYNFNDPQTTVGRLYAADLLGGFVGAVMISVFLIPVFGILQTLIFAITLKILSALLILTGSRFSIE